MSVKYKTALFRDLLYFCEVLNCRKISEAAEKNGIKTSNLSHIIKTLEQRTGKQLFYRHSHGVIPTPDALELAESIKKIEYLFKNVLKKIDSITVVSEIKLQIPENIIIEGLKEFAAKNNLKIITVSAPQKADVIVSYEKPQNADSLIFVENRIGKTFKQTIWVCAENQQESINLARFIISRLHS